MMEENELNLVDDFLRPLNNISKDLDFRIQCSTKVLRKIEKSYSANTLSEHEKAVYTTYLA